MLDLFHQKYAHLILKGSRQKKTCRIFDICSNMGGGAGKNIFFKKNVNETKYSWEGGLEIFPILISN